MRDRMRELALLIGTAVRTDPRRCLGTLLEPLGSLMYPLCAVLLGYVATSIVNHNPAGIGIGCAGLLTAITLQYVANYVGTGLRMSLAERVGFAFDAEITRLTGELPGLEHHELPAYQDRLELLRQSQGLLGQSLNYLITTASAVAGAMGTGVVLVLLHPFVLLLVLFALPALPIAALQQRWHADAEAESAEPARLARHLRELTIDRAAGMELRVFGLTNEVRSRMSEAWMSARRPMQRAELQSAATAMLRSFLFALGFALAVGFVLWRASHGHGGPGEVVTAVLVCQQVQAQVVGPAYNVAGLGRVLRSAGRLLWLRQYARDVSARTTGNRPAPTRLERGIVLDNVSFRYPGTDHWVLRNVSVRLPADSAIAIVGENGAGKTTLVKLLCRLYEPTEGTIRVDGVPLAELDIQSWRRRLSAAFQDFARFELRARHSVGVGDLPRLDDDTAVTAALDRAGSAGIMRGFAHGGEQQLGSGWPGGIDLSTGQWQKLSLGRALMRTEPLLVFFDEPTASLDAPTEHALFERYITQARRMGAAAGTVTVLVSHRFSTVRSADMILVLLDGRLSQVGTHDELMAKPGLYSELYSLQARSYA